MSAETTVMASSECPPFEMHLDARVALLELRLIDLGLMPPDQVARGISALMTICDDSECVAEFLEEFIDCTGRPWGFDETGPVSEKLGERANDHRTLRISDRAESQSLELPRTDRGR